MAFSVDGLVVPVVATWTPSMIQMTINAVSDPTPAMPTSIARIAEGSVLALGLLPRTSQPATLDAHSCNTYRSRKAPPIQTRA